MNYNDAPMEEPMSFWQLVAMSPLIFGALITILILVLITSLVDLKEWLLHEKRN